MRPIRDKSDEYRAHLSKDPVLKELIDRIALPERWVNRERKEVFQELLDSILGQQLSVKAAATITLRFRALFPDNNPGPGKLLTLSNEDLRAVGVSRQKASYLHAIAEQWEKGQLDKVVWDQLLPEEVMKHLLPIKGVGRWTVEMVLMFCLKHEDIFPVDDLGIQQAMMRLYGISGTKRQIITQMEEVTAPWSPFRSYASMYLWHSKTA